MDTTFQSSLAPARDSAPLPLFPQTRIRPPLAGHDILARPRLLHALIRAAATHPLTLLLAPAGYGKTTLLASLAERMKDGGGRIYGDMGEAGPHFAAGAVAEAAPDTAAAGEIAGQPALDGVLPRRLAAGRCRPARADRGRRRL